MKVFSFFCVLLFINQYEQLNNGDFDMDYINYLIENFSMNKSNRSLQLKQSEQESQSRELAGGVVYMKTFQKEFFHMVRDTIFQSIKTYIQGVENQQLDQSKFPPVDKEIENFLAENFEFLIQNEAPKPDTQFQKFDAYKKAQDAENVDQYFRFSMNFDGEKKTVMTIEITLKEETKDRKNQKDEKGLKKERTKEMTIIFMNDIGQAKIKVPIVIGKHQRLLDFVQGNVEDFLSKSLQLVHKAELLDQMVYQVLTKNFGYSNQSPSQNQENTIQEISDEKTLPSVQHLDLSKILNHAEESQQFLNLSLHYNVYKLSMETQYAQQMAKANFKIPDETIEKKEFLYFLLVPNSQDLENIDVIIRLHDNKISYGFFSNFFQHFNYLDISTYAFVGINLDLVCKQISLDLKKNLLLLYDSPDQLVQRNGDKFENKIKEYEENLQKNFNDFYKMAFEKHKEHNVMEPYLEDTIRKQNICSKLNLPQEQGEPQIQAFHFHKCYPKESQFIVQVYQISLLQEFQQNLILLYNNEEYRNFYLKQKVEPFISLQKEKGFSQQDWQRQIKPTYYAVSSSTEQQKEISQHIVNLNYLYGKAETVIQYDLIKFEHKLPETKRLLLLL